MGKYRSKNYKGWVDSQNSCKYLSIEPQWLDEDGSKKDTDVGEKKERS